MMGTAKSSGSASESDGGGSPGSGSSCESSRSSGASGSAAGVFELRNLALVSETSGTMDVVNTGAVDVEVSGVDLFTAKTQRARRMEGD